MIDQMITSLAAEKNPSQTCWPQPADFTTGIQHSVVVSLVSPPVVRVAVIME